MKIGHEKVKTLLSLFLLNHQPSLTQDSEMLGDVVLSDAKFFDNLVDAASLLQKHPHDAHPAFFAERLQRGDAVELFHKHLNSGSRDDFKCIRPQQHPPPGLQPPWITGASPSR